MKNTQLNPSREQFPVRLLRKTSDIRTYVGHTAYTHPLGLYVCNPKMLPCGNIIAGPGRSKSLRPGIGRSCNYKRPFWIYEFFNTLVGSLGHVCTIHIMRLSVAASILIVIVPHI